MSSSSSSCVAQKQHVKSSKQLLQDLCSQANKNSADSVLLVKRIMAMTLSNITYLRLVFDDSCYLATPYDDKTMMMLNENSENHGVQQHIKWLSGAFHALDRQYLKSLIYAFYTDLDDPEGSTIEMYKLNVVYSQKIIRDPEVTENADELEDSWMPGIEFEDLQNKTKTTFNDLQKMIITLSTIVAELEALPPGVNMTMRLAYNKHCPKDYLPPGFKRDAQKQPNIDAKHKVCVRAGSMASKFHGIKLKAAFDTRNVGKGFKRARYELYEEVDEFYSDDEETTPRNENTKNTKKSTKKLNFDTIDTLATSGNEITPRNERTENQETIITPIQGNNDIPSPIDRNTGHNSTIIDDSSRDTLSEMNDKTRKTTASSYINTPESRVSFDQHSEFSPIERDGISLDLKVPSPYKPVQLPSKDLGKDNFIIDLLQYLILRKFYSPLLIQNRFSLTKKIMWELTELLENRGILDPIPTSSLKRREVCGWKAYKVLREECKYRDLQTDAGLDDIYRETWNETITTINVELAKINRRKNKSFNYTSDSSYTQDSSMNNVSSCEKEYMMNRKVAKVNRIKKSHRSVSFLESTLSSVNRSSSMNMVNKFNRVSINDTPSTITNTSLNESSNSATLAANTPLRFL